MWTDPREFSGSSEIDWNWQRLNSAEFTTVHQDRDGIFVFKISTTFNKNKPSRKLFLHVKNSSFQKLVSFQQKRQVKKPDGQSPAQNFHLVRKLLKDWQKIIVRARDDVRRPKSSTTYFKLDSSDHRLKSRCFFFSPPTRFSTGGGQDDLFFRYWGYSLQAFCMLARKAGIPVCRRQRKNRSWDNTLEGLT